MVFGMFCVHEYAHTNASAAKQLPKALKGIDLALYVACQALGLKVKVAPILEIDNDYGGISLEELHVNGSGGHEVHRCKQQQESTSTGKEVTVLFDIGATEYNSDGSEYNVLDDVRSSKKLTLSEE